MAGGDQISQAVTKIASRAVPVDLPFVATVSKRGVRMPRGCWITSGANVVSLDHGKSHFEHIGVAAYRPPRQGGLGPVHQAARQHPGFRPRLDFTVASRTAPAPRSENQS